MPSVHFQTILLLTAVAISLEIVRALYHSSVAFRSNQPRIGSRFRPGKWTMKWSFSNASPKPGSNGGVQDVSNLVGVDGEFYFHPARQAKLKSPPEACGKSMVVPILPYNNIIVPGASESITVFEMKNRQLFNDLHNGVFGMSFYSQQNQKLS